MNLFPKESEKPDRLTPVRAVLLFIAMVLVVPLIGFAIVKIHIPQVEEDAYGDLAMILIPHPPPCN